jgi:hypothetical protein
MDNKGVFWNGLGILLSGLACFLPIITIEFILIPVVLEKAIELGIPHAVNILRATYFIFGIPAVLFTLYGAWLLTMTSEVRREDYNQKVQEAENKAILRMMQDEQSNR